MTRIASAFDRARAENRAAFIPYLTAGDPSAEATAVMARALERAGADILELGVAFSDPIADGPVLQRAASRALEAGMTLESVFAIARRIRSETRLALVLFTYLNPLLARGDRAASEARDAGFDGVLVTDMPPDEALDYQPSFRGAGLDTIFLVSPTSTPARMRAAARLSSGFLYVVSRTGTTGARHALPPDLVHTVRRARRATAGRLPIAIGFGISTPEAVRHAAALADGVVVGSALVEAAEEAGPAFEPAVEAFARPLAAACRRR